MIDIENMHRDIYGIWIIEDKFITPKQAEKCISESSWSEYKIN